MRLHQFLSSVFPRLLRTKSERNQQHRNTADKKAIVQKASSNSHIELSDLKYAFDTVDPAYRHGSSAHGEVIAKKDCGQTQSVRGGVEVTEYGMDWFSEHYDASRIGVSVSMSRSMIRTNPWLASPKSSHNGVMQPQTGSIAGTLSLPTTPTTSSVNKTIEYRQALARGELGLMLQVPGNLDDSASEGYASSAFRSPSFTDLDSIEGGIDSALASSVSSESDFEWGASMAPPHSLFHVSSAPGLDCSAEEMINEATFNVGDRCIETTKSDKEELHYRKDHHAEDVSLQKDREEFLIEENSFDIIVPLHHPNELKLVKCYSDSERPSSELAQQSSSRYQCKIPSGFECIKQTIAHTDNIETQGDSVEDNQDEEKTELQNMDRVEDGNASARSLGEISESLQDKVRRLHEQKSFVDAMFRRAREVDQQRESQFANFRKFRSQFVAAKKQALLRKLQELQMMLGNQSTKLQVVYDAVLLVQWPKVFNVDCEMSSTIH